MHINAIATYYSTILCACESHASSRGFPGLLALTTKMSKQQSLGMLGFSKGRKAPNKKVISSKSNKRSYQLSLSKRQPLGKPGTKRQKRPGEVYLDTCKAPPGITNPANNCYCNALVQCLFNNPHFLSRLKAVFACHPDHCDQQCCISGNPCN